MGGEELRTIIGFGAAAAAVLCILLFGYFFFAGRRQGSLHALLKASRGGGVGASSLARQRVQQDVTGREYERLKKIQKKQVRKAGKAALSKEERYFHAGLFTRRDIKRFEQIRYLIVLIGLPVAVFLGTSMGSFGALLGLAIGGIGAYIVPTFVLDRKIKRRGEEIMFYLPLVIEQISIGVSSSLDIGPCLQRVVSMADERDTHNVVTELLRQAQYHIKSGITLEEAMSEIGTKSGHTELKHAFMALASVAKHGGEISRQLQELADSVSAQRETQIEAKIKKLELEATGPVALVFAGFLVVILTGFGLQISKVFTM